MSGLTRPSTVGPCELYGSSERDCQQSAPTANDAGDDAGEPMLPAGTKYSRGGLQLTRSERGDETTRYPTIAQNTVRSRPVDCRRQSPSNGGRPCPWSPADASMRSLETQ